MSSAKSKRGGRSKGKGKGKRPASPAAVLEDPVPLPLEEPAAEAEGMVGSVTDSVFGGALAFAGVLRDLDCKPMTLHLSIDGINYISTKLNTEVMLELLPRVTGLLGSALQRAMSTGQGLNDIGLEALVGVSDRAMRDGLVPLIRDLLVNMKCNRLRTTGAPGPVVSDFSAHFAGEYAHLFKVCAFALAHNLKGPTYGGG